MTPKFSIFALAIKFDRLFLAIFQVVHLFVSSIFDKLAPPRIYVYKDVLNYYLVYSSTYNSLKSAKNVFFFLFCILVDMPMGEGYSPPLGTLLSMEWNITESFGVEWNMEWKIFSMEMEWKKIACMEYGKIIFRSIPCPAQH